MTEVGLIVSLQSISNNLSAAFHTAEEDVAPPDDEGQGSTPPDGEGESCADVQHGGDPVEEDADGGQGSRKKKHRRGRSKKRKWKPYNKLTWEEKRELEDRESRRANRIRAERFAHGQPVAPYNTTQFLMEDHNVQEPDLASVPNGHRPHRESTGTLDSDEYYSSPEDEEEFLQKEFCEVYDNIHAERLSAMTKPELIQEYIQLEDRVEKLEQKLGLAGRGGGSKDCNHPPGVTLENLEKIRIFHQEMRKLAEENERLRRENEELRSGQEAAVDSLVASGSGSLSDHSQSDREQDVTETEMDEDHQVPEDPEAGVELEERDEGLQATQA